MSDFEGIPTLEFKKKVKFEVVAKQNFCKILVKWGRRVLPFVIKFPYFRDFFYGNGSQKITEMHGNGIPNIPDSTPRSGKDWHPCFEH